MLANRTEVPKWAPHFLLYHHHQPSSSSNLSAGSEKPSFPPLFPYPPLNFPFVNLNKSRRVRGRATATLTWHCAKKGSVVAPFFCFLNACAMHGKARVAWGGIGKQYLGHLDGGAWCSGGDGNRINHAEGTTFAKKRRK